MTETPMSPEVTAMRNALIAIRLEVPAPVADDLFRKFEAAIAELQAKNEALEKEVERLKTKIDWHEKNWETMRHKIASLNAGKKDLEAQAAAMRQGFEKCIQELGRAYGFGDTTSSSYHKYLANDAGKELLEENQRLRKALGFIEDTASTYTNPENFEMRSKASQAGIVFSALESCAKEAREALQGKGE